MADTTISTNMLLPVPVVGVDAGPDWAENINSCLSIIDSHDHTTGSGVAITPAGINISSDLGFANNNATNLRSVRLYTQSAPLALTSDLGCLYRSVVDLYYNDGNGNQIRLTQGGSIAGTSGSIANLVSPASASYVSASQTFVWQADANKAASMDLASLILRNTTTSSSGLTLSPPLAMGSDYALTLPQLPASQKFMTLDASGNMSAPWAVDSSTLEVSANVVQVKDLGITTAKLAASGVTTAKIADLNVTRAKLVALGQQLSSAISFSTSSTTTTNVTGLAVTLTTTGRPVMLILQAAASPFGQSYMYVTWGGASGSSANLRISVAGTNLNGWKIFQTQAGTQMCSGSYAYVDVASAGTYTYQVRADVAAGTDSFVFNNMTLIAYEL